AARGLSALLDAPGAAAGDGAEPARVGVRDLVETVRSTLAAPAAARGLALRGELAPDLPAAAAADGARARQMLVHLVLHALHHAQPGEIVLRAAVAEDPARDGAVLCVLDVEDTGGAVPTTEAAMRTGGAARADARSAPDLAAAQALARALGGEVAVLREGWQGCFLRATLPAGLRCRTSDGIPPRPARLLQLPPCTVVAAERRPLERQLLEAMLAATPHRLRVEADLRQAIRLARQLRPDLMLVDLCLLDTAGAAALRALRTEPGFAPGRIVALLAESGDGEEACLSGLFDGYAADPCSERTLYSELERALAARRVPRPAAVEGDAGAEGRRRLVVARSLPGA
ncbi:MAG: hypothetical protein HYV18_00160, partial [Gammaproteobacteria bacterium]|nr:hypothetical protein [Gammaproteobacteria bacterium]